MVQITIQIVAHLVAFIYVFTLSTITNFSTRLHLHQGSASLHQLRLWQSISSFSMTWNLPFLQISLCFPYIVFHLLPASLWLAALTPIPSYTSTSASIRVPLYSSDPARTFWNHSTLTVEDYQGPATRNDKGVFSYTPAGVWQGQIINAASNVSIQGTARVNPKKDNSHLSYSERSYGSGCGTGLEDIVFERTGTGSPLIVYTYQELGYVTDVECWKNSSSAWGITLWENSGVLPNSQYIPGATSS
jgi:hypothetical protein